MSCLYRGSLINTDLSRNAMGGTEQMRTRLIKYIDQSLLKQVAIHLSRPRTIYPDIPNILYCHDLASDPENRILSNGGWKSFKHFVFVSNWQMNTYLDLYGIPAEICSVIHNAIEKEYDPSSVKSSDKLNLIYHTTPHRGLEILVPIVQMLANGYKNIHLDVYSSFKVYGWEEMDKPYEKLFKTIKQHPNMTYHGAVSNEKVLTALDKAHIFLYPCIWTETSCIALIEAIRSGCLCIHPDAGALSETAAGQTLMYDDPRNKINHISVALDMCRKGIDILHTKTIDGTLPQNSIKVFTEQWTKTINQFLK